MQVPLLLKDGKASASGTGASARLALLDKIGAEISEEAPMFNWLFVRTPGPPQGLVMPFPDESRRWAHAEYLINHALDNLANYRATCGDELDPESPWVQFGAAPWDDDALPEYLWELPHGF